MDMEVRRRYLSIDDIHKQYLPISKKKIRTLVKHNLPVVTIGSRLYVNRTDLEDFLDTKEMLAAKPE